MNYRVFRTMLIILVLSFCSYSVFSVNGTWIEGRNQRSKFQKKQNFEDILMGQWISPYDLKTKINEKNNIEFQKEEDGRYSSTEKTQENFIDSNMWKLLCNEFKELSIRKCFSSSNLRTKILEENNIEFQKEEDKAYENVYCNKECVLCCSEDNSITEDFQESFIDPIEISNEEWKRHKREFLDFRREKKDKVKNDKTKRSEEKNHHLHEKLKLQNEWKKRLETFKKDEVESFKEFECLQKQSQEARSMGLALLIDQGGETPRDKLSHVGTGTLSLSSHFKGDCQEVVIVSSSLLYNFVCRKNNEDDKEHPENKQLKDISVLKRDWELFEVPGTQFVIFFPKNFVKQIDTYFKKNESGFKNITNKLDDFVELESYLEKLDKPEVKIEDFRKIFRSHNNFTAKEVMGLNWFISLSGHGLKGTRVADLKLEVMQALLEFFNRNLLLKFLFVRTCYGGGENIEFLKFYNKNERVLRLLHFPLIVQGIDDTVVTICAFDVPAFFQRIRNGESFESALQSVFLLKDANFGRANILQVFLPRSFDFFPLKKFDWVKRIGNVSRTINKLEGGDVITLWPLSKQEIEKLKKGEKTQEKTFLLRPKKDPFIVLFDQTKINFPPIKVRLLNTKSLPVRCKRLFYDKKDYCYFCPGFEPAWVLAKKQKNEDLEQQIKEKDHPALFSSLQRFYSFADNHRYCYLFPNFVFKEKDSIFTEIQVFNQVDNGKGTLLTVPYVGILNFLYNAFFSVTKWMHLQTKKKFIINKLIGPNDISPLLELKRLLTVPVTKERFLLEEALDDHIEKNITLENVSVQVWNEYFIGKDGVPDFTVKRKLSFDFEGRRWKMNGSGWNFHLDHKHFFKNRMLEGLSRNNKKKRLQVVSACKRFLERGVGYLEMFNYLNNVEDINEEVVALAIMLLEESDYGQRQMERIERIEEKKQEKNKIKLSFKKISKEVREKLGLDEKIEELEKIIEEKEVKIKNEKAKTKERLKNSRKIVERLTEIIEKGVKNNRGIQQANGFVWRYIEEDIFSNLSEMLIQHETGIQAVFNEIRRRSFKADKLYDLVCVKWYKQLISQKKGLEVLIKIAQGGIKSKDELTRSKALSLWMSLLDDKNTIKEAADAVKEGIKYSSGKVWYEVIMLFEILCFEGRKEVPAILDVVLSEKKDIEKIWGTLLSFCKKESIEVLIAIAQDGIKSNDRETRERAVRLWKKLLSATEGKIVKQVMAAVKNNSYEEVHAFRRFIFDLGVRDCKRLIISGNKKAIKSTWDYLNCIDKKDFLRQETCYDLLMNHEIGIEILTMIAQDEIKSNDKETTKKAIRLWKKLITNGKAIVKARNIAYKGLMNQNEKKRVLALKLWYLLLSNGYGKNEGFKIIRQFIFDDKESLTTKLNILDLLKALANKGFYHEFAYGIANKMVKNKSERIRSKAQELLEILPKKTGFFSWITR